MSYREKMEKKIPQGKKTVVMQSLLDDKGNVLRVSYIYLSDTMEIWFDQSSRSNREENGKAEINPCFYYLRMIRLTWIYYRVSRKINMKKDIRLLMNVSNEKLK